MKIQIITICVALFTPFVAAACAYYFSVSRKHKLENEEAAYKNFYAPLMGILTQYQISNIWYGMAVGGFKQAEFRTIGKIKADNRLQNLIRKNIVYVPKTIGTSIHHFLMSSDDFFYREEKGYEKYEHNAILASNAFDLIITESLKEASRLSKKLGYPDIAVELLHEFQKSFVNHPDNRHKLH